jgi:PAS domain S-box-containing protein
MKRFFASLSLRIWLPFAISLALGMSFLGYYYPKQQAKLFRESTEKNLDEISKILALSISLSLDYQSFEALSNSINMATAMSDFEFVALIQKDSITSVESVFASNPQKIDPNVIFNLDSTKFISRKHPIKTELIDGYILIASSRFKLEQKVSELNNPVYLALGVVLFFSLFAFFLFAQHLSRPVAHLTSVANQLKSGNFSISIEKGSNATEVSDLNLALFQLRDALVEARQRNEDFNRKLEDEIISRTKDLENTKLRLLEAQEVAELGNFEIDLDSGNWSASEKVYQIFQIPAEFPLINNSWAKFFEQGNSDIALKLFTNSLNESLYFQQDFLIHPDENPKLERWISISGKAVADIPGSSHVIRGTIQDITKRKLIENEVRKLSLVAKKTSNCVIITDVNYVINWVNESTLKLTGYSWEEIIGQTPSMFQFEKTSIETKNIIRSKLNDLQEVNVKILNRSKSGVEYWLDINIVPLFDDEEQHIGFMAVEIDITERVNFEQSIRDSEENYRIILENSSELIHTIDSDGKLIWANRSWKEKLGVSDKNIEGFSLVDFLDKDTFEEFKSVMPRLNNGEIITDLDCVFLSTNGSSLSLQGRAIPYYKDQKIVGSQAYLHDITLIKKAELDLKNLLELTQNQNNRLRNFTHIVSHNLRSHSSNLIGLIKLLSIEWPSFKENVYFSNLESAVNNLMDVIQNLSEVANIQTDDQKKYVEIDIHNTVKKVISSIYGLAQNAGVDIRFESQDSLSVIGDNAYLESVVLNLLTNAIKYKSDKRKPFVEIKITQEGDFVCLKFIDNGLGIDLERQGRKIFGMYKTFHKHPDARGVGLFLTKNQVEAMGGKIEVESKVDEGTVFTLFLRSENE